MILPLLTKFTLFRRQVLKRVHKLMNLAYPRLELRSSAFLAEGMELIEIEAFRAGQTVKQVSIYPDEEEGYHIEIVYNTHPLEEEALG